MVDVVNKGGGSLDSRCRGSTGIGEGTTDLVSDCSLKPIRQFVQVIAYATICVKGRSY